MAKVHILNVTVHNNPAPFFTPFQFEIHFECLEELQDGNISTFYFFFELINILLIQINKHLRFGVQNNLRWLC
jgi:hypothetical protein